MQNNITKAFKRKSALRKMASGGRPGFDEDTMKLANSRIAELRTPEGAAAFNERQAGLNSGIQAGLGASGEVMLTGRPDMKTNPDQPALTPSVNVMPEGALLAEGHSQRLQNLNSLARQNMANGDMTTANAAMDRGGLLLESMQQAGMQNGLRPIQNPSNMFAADETATGVTQPGVTPAPAPIPTPAAEPPPVLRASGPQQQPSFMTTLVNAVNPVQSVTAAGEAVRQTPSSLRRGRGQGARRERSIEDSIWFNKPGMREGGRVKGPGGPTDDKVGPVMLSDDEYVLPADTADAIGRDNLDAVRMATHDFSKTKDKKGLRGMRDGGAFMIGPDGRPMGQQSTSRAVVPYVQPGVPAVPAGGAQAMVPVAQPIPAGVAPPPAGAGGVPPSGTVGHNPPPASAQAPAPRSGLRAGLGGLAIAGAAEGYSGYQDDKTLRAADEARTGQIVAEGATRVGSAALGAKLGAKGGALLGPKGAVAGGLAGGLAGYIAPDAAAPFVGHQTARDRAREVRNENATRLRSEEVSENSAVTNAPAGNYYRPQDVRMDLRSPTQENSLPSNAGAINARFDELARGLRAEHGKRVDTPFGGTTLNRNSQLLELEKARAQALGTDLSNHATMRGQDMQARAAGTNARAESQVGLLREQRLAQEAATTRQEKAVDSLHSNITQLVGDDPEMQTELFRFATNTEGFMDAFENAPAAERRKILATLNEMLPSYQARLDRGLRRGSAVEEGFVQPDRVRKGLTMSDINNTDANAMDYILRGGLFGGNTEWAQFGGQMIPTKELQKGTRGKDHVSADLVRFIDQYRNK